MASDDKTCYGIGCKSFNLRYPVNMVEFHLKAQRDALHELHQMVETSSRLHERRERQRQQISNEVRLKKIENEYLLKAQAGFSSKNHQAKNTQTEEGIPNQDYRQIPTYYTRKKLEPPLKSEIQAEVAKLRSNHKSEFQRPILQQAANTRKTQLLQRTLVAWMLPSTSHSDSQSSLTAEHDHSTPPAPQSQLASDKYLSQPALLPLPSQTPNHKQPAATPTKHIIPNPAISHEPANSPSPTNQNMHKHVATPAQKNKDNQNKHNGNEQQTNQYQPVISDNVNKRTKAAADHGQLHKQDAAEKAIEINVLESKQSTEPKGVGLSDVLSKYTAQVSDFSGLIHLSERDVQHGSDFQSKPKADFSKQPKAMVERKIVRSPINQGVLIHDGGKSQPTSEKNKSPNSSKISGKRLDGFKHDHSRVTKPTKILQHKDTLDLSFDPSIDGAI